MVRSVASTPSDQAGSENEKPKTRLPSVLWAPDDEFATMDKRRKASRWWQVRRRILRHASTRVFQSQAAAIIGGYAVRGKRW